MVLSDCSPYVEVVRVTDLEHCNRDAEAALERGSLRHNRVAVVLGKELSRRSLDAEAALEKVPLHDSPCAVTVPAKEICCQNQKTAVAREKGLWQSIPVAEAAVPAMALLQNTRAAGLALVMGTLNGNLAVVAAQETVTERFGLDGIQDWERDLSRQSSGDGWEQEMAPVNHNYL